ncbi:hypothetical protein G6F49_010507 [Rhizopus delemar]|nr:hypothetical protein G6F49_010507 [Rhizopus delemar]KAG1580298.1 hypothetical protein G6F48_010547 [Rhizopus delemar]KAG1633284.1 hypothetical protein G6F44_010449 [Rhizopus delemar]
MNGGYIKPSSWDMYLQFITLAYNTAKHASTAFSPFHLMFGRQPVLPNEEGLIIPELKAYETENWINYLNKYIPLLHGKALKNIKASQGYQKTFYDKESKFWSGPYNIISKNNEEGTSWKIIKQGDSRFHITTANARHMRPYYQDQNSSKSDTRSTSASSFEGGNNVVNTYTPLSIYYELLRRRSSSFLQQLPLSDDLPDVEDSCDIDEAENLRLAEYLENIQKYHNSSNSIYQQKMSKIKSGMRMHTLSKMEDAMKRSVANISDVDESSTSLPPRQRQQFFFI